MHYATKDNTVFATVCDYPNPQEMSASIQRTADYFQIPLTYISYGEPWINFLQKYIKLHNYLVANLTTFKYAFFVDVRDVVFVKNHQDILDDFNLAYQGGVIFAPAVAANLHPYSDPEFAYLIEAGYGSEGYANTGTYAGEINEVIHLLQETFKLNEAFRNNADHPIVRFFNKRPQFRENMQQYIVDDQFLIQALQLDASSNIRIDYARRLFSFFGNHNFPALNPRRISNVRTNSESAIGTAGILHSHTHSQNQEKWDAWIDREICRC